MISIPVTYVEPNSVFGDAIQNGFLVYDPETKTAMVQNSAGVLIELDDGPAEYKELSQEEWDAFLWAVEQNGYEVSILLFG